MLPIAPAVMSARPKSTPNLAFFFDKRKMKKSKTTTATMRNRLKINFMTPPPPIQPKAMPSFSMKSSLNQLPNTGISSPIVKCNLTQIFRTWSKSRTRNITKNDFSKPWLPDFFTVSSV